ncbi:MAG TPA: DUF4386 domain-containing protein [Thermoanaerobaculia bacterium]|jgi:hypothetical protein
MTLRTNSRVAGIAFLLYIAAALTGIILASRAARGAGLAERLASIAQHAGAVRLGFVLELIGCFCALVLAVTLYAITRGVDADVARLGMVCRVGEGVIGAVGLQKQVGRLWLATASGAAAPEPGTVNALAEYLLKLPWSSDIGATFFAVGSTCFAWLLLRGRIVPVWLAGLGVFASLLAVAVLPLVAVGGITGIPAQIVWLPMLVFEVGLALVLIFRGAAPPAGAYRSQ